MTLQSFDPYKEIAQEINNDILTENPYQNKPHDY